MFQQPVEHGRTTAPPSGRRYFSTINVLIKFHEDWIIIATSRKMTRPLAAITNILTKFHKHWTTNVTFSVITRIYYSHVRKTGPPPGSHVFQQTRTIFKLI
ncbi:hypothetical protein DPMN_188434 [Dreissena polymorpha]|uniref:Uncharacterized protein n=1 Tax=Dreissena polymorpha TaxID=45954 RepID=A0A9D4DTT4_DREPO|nr:hypothetical protein DPMN_188434 [Dreissena polymorpha]